MRRWFPGLVALLALGAIGLALARMLAPLQGLSVTQMPVGEIPATLYRPAAGGPAPVVVIAHGFAGSRRMMEPFATTLAQAGFIAVTFDFPGHGGNPTPLAGGLSDDAAAAGVLMAALGRVVEAARPLGDGRFALLGHSMAGDIVTRWAIAHPGAEATVGLSLFAKGATPDLPRNLLVIVGAWEPEILQAEARRLVGMAAPGGVVEENVTYGDPATGRARRLVLADGVEHIGVIYARESLEAARAWLNAAFGRSAAGLVDARGPWIGVLLGGLVLLAWPLSRLLPRVEPLAQGGGLPWRRFWVVALLPAVLTPLVLRVVPTHALPLLLGDYLAAHCALYGVLTAALLWRLGAPRPRWPGRPGGAALAAAALAGFAILGIGLAIDRFALAFVPAPHRAWLVPVLLCGTLPWFAADEWAARGPGAARLAYPATKALFLLSLVGAVALDPPRLFFLVIIVPVMLVFLLVFGLLSRWAFRATGSPWPAAAANALALAWAIAATFPVVP